MDKFNEILNNIYRGIIIVYPHGSYITDNEKSIIVKSLYLKDISHKPLLLIQNKEALGIIYLNDPKQIDLNKFNTLRKYHKITEEEREKWWKSYKELYQYDIIKKDIFDLPVPINYKTGPQVLVKPESISKLQNIFIGTSGYKYEWWNKSEYDKFDVYDKTFNTVEINASFYNFYKKSTWDKIINNSPDNFVYSIKVNRSITHYRKFNRLREFIKPFIGMKKVKCLLFQFPPNFKYSDDNIKKLNDLSKYYDKAKTHMNFVFEFRNISWYLLDNLTKLNDLFEKKKHWIIAVTNIDNKYYPSFDEYNNLINSQQLDVMYVRMHGTADKYEGSYSKKSLKELGKFIRSNNTKEEMDIFIYFNNTDSLYKDNLPDAVHDAIELQHILI